MIDVQLRQIAGFWILGMVVGSLVSVFAKDAKEVERLRRDPGELVGDRPAAVHVRRDPKKNLRFAGSLALHDLWAAHRYC